MTSNTSHKLFSVIVVITLVAMLFSCKKDPSVNIETFEITKENMTIGAKTVGIMGSYSYSGTIDGITACVSENEFNFNVEKFPAELSGKNFAVNITGLKTGTTYYYYYSVDYGMDKPYQTEQKQFITGDYSLPTVITATVSFVGHDNAICGGEVTDDGGSEVTARGLCWSQQHNPTLSDIHSVDSCGTGAFTTHITDLTLNTTYYVRAYATNEKGTAYGNEMEFTTSAQTPTVTTLEVIEIDTTSARVKCEVGSDGGSTVTERGVCWSKQHEPTLEDEYQANGSGLGLYVCRISGLESNTTYYVRAYAKNASGTAFGEVLTFKTGTVVFLPSVTTVEITEVTATTAICLCNVSDDGGSEVTERGACWSLSQSPTINSSHANMGSGMGEYTIQLSGLTANKTYYVRAYAKNSKGIAYGEQKSFTTLEGLPVVNTGSVSDITATTAKCSGNVVDQGASAVTERGICWGTSHNPTVSGSHVTNGTGTGLFTCQMTGLTPNTTYYVRAYAKNTQGISYGSELSFVALEGLPSVTTGNVSDITATTAKCSGNVTDQGASTVTERGICWGTNHNPTIIGNHANSGTGAGSYICQMTGLTNGTTYYVRAYARNTQGITYGEEKEFSTLANLPSVTTAEATNITQTTATGGGNVTADGGATVTERGICWSTSQNPTVNGNHASNGSGTGTFSVNMTSLSPGTTYYVRAYATNSAGTAYGNQKSFTTTATMPTVTTGQVTNITQTTALGGGNVTNDGGASVTARGVCWSTSHNPTVSGSHASGGTGTGSFTANMTGLTANTTYYVRAYATNSQGTSYGSEVSFTTSQNISAPTVTTSQVSSITQTTAVGGGNVTSDGGATVTERGICWSTSHNPTTSGSHANNGTGTGSYTVQMSGLTANTTYYVRAYAINSQGTSYGSEVSFTTEQIPSYTISVSANPTNGGTVAGGGTYQQGQSCTVTATANTGYTFLRWTENGTQVSTNANYTFTVSDNRTLVAQFQANSYTVSVSATPTSGGSATGGGNYNYGQSCTVSASAANGYTFLRWTENGTQVSTNASYTFTVTGNRTLVAQFQVNGYTISASANPTAGGTVTGAGTYNYGQSCTLTATANTGYTFLRWTENGEQVSTNATYTFNVTGNRTLVAQFQIQSYTITASANPTAGGSVSGAGSYNYGQSCTLTASASTNYTFVNWTENGNAVSSNASYSFTVTANRTFVANFEPTVPVGAINGLFSVSATQQVYFSQGNLQYQASSNTWRFASNQYNYIGSANSNISINYSGWIDLFGWGTSGWNNGNVYYQPYDKSNTGTSNNGYGYGPTDGTNYNNNLTEDYANADWGIFNAIINGGNQNNQWRVLTRDEWGYLSFTRQDAALKKGMATVASVKGIIILPDEWTLPEGLSFSNITYYSTSVNVYSLSEWVLMEEAGAVFLPAAGLRSGTQINNAGSYGHYWSSICQGLAYGYTIYIAPPAGGFNHNLVADYRRRDLGCSVRLVQDFNR